ncbi:MAG TPA: FHA domain-containing protein, partial [Polyangiaceae bacterium]|nr:FHA domain-containing protein [Polyangiaceae bacterium]
MESAFLLRATRFDGSLLCERRVATLPIRIGRNALNDFALSDLGIAEFHAIVEEIGGRLCVRDLNSTQGVAVRIPPQVFPTRIPARASADLKSGGFQFALGNAALVSLFVDTSSSPPPRKTSAGQGSVLGNPSLLRGPGSTLQLPRFSEPGRRASPSSLPPTLAMDFTATVTLPRVTPPPPNFATPPPPHFA